MSDLRNQFEEAAKRVQSLSNRPDNDTLLRLYGLYKQGSDGDVSGKRPGMTAFVKRAKFDAWATLKGTSNQTAMQDYISLVSKLAD